MVPNLLDFTGKTVATAIAFVRQGANIVVNGHSIADETLARIKNLGGEAIFVKGEARIFKNCDWQHWSANYTSQCVTTENTGDGLNMALEVGADGKTSPGVVMNIPTA